MTSFKMTSRSFKIAVGVTGLLALGCLIYSASQQPAAARPSDMRSKDDGDRIRDAIRNDAAVPQVAPVGYDVTIVVFSDYQCPYCRKMHGTLEALVHSDSKVRVVYRDWPIFGAPSVEAAKVAMASRFQGKHAAFNDELMKVQGRLSSAEIRAAAQRAGVNWPRLEDDQRRHKAEIDAALARTDGFARMIGLSGTPALIVDSYLFPGAISPDTLKLAVQTAREHRPVARGT